MIRTCLALSLFTPLLFGGAEEDVISLLQDISKNAKNSSAMLSLAEGYKSLKQLDSSIRWYKNATEQAEGDELLASWIGLGKCYEETKQDDLIIQCYLKAIKANPKRAEPFYHLAKFFRMKGQNDLCTLYATQGKALPLPEEGALFVSKEIYSYLLDEELSIAAYYTSHKEEGFQAINRLLLNKETPWYIKNQAFSNVRYYMKPLQASYTPLDITPLKINEKENYYSINPSIQKTEGGYSVICRTVNYEKTNEENNSRLYSRDPLNPKIVTRNLFLNLDKEFKTLTQEEIVDNSSYRKFPGWIEGQEDCRLFSFQGEDFFTCTILDANPTHIAQMGLGKLSEGTCTITPLKGPDPKRAEKNWLPFNLNDQIHAIYSYDPLTILQLNPETGECKKTIETNSSFDGSHFRGSAGPIPFDEGYLVIVHEMTHAGKYFYYHRFIFLNQEFQITKVSLPFYFKVVGVEYCSGMTLDHDEKNIVLTLGVEDKEAFIALIPVDDVKNLLTK